MSILNVKTCCFFPWKVALLAIWCFIGHFHLSYVPFSNGYYLNFYSIYSLRRCYFEYHQFYFFVEQIYLKLLLTNYFATTLAFSCHLLLFSLFLTVSFCRFSRNLIYYVNVPNKIDSMSNISRNLRKFYSDIAHWQESAHISHMRNHWKQNTQRFIIKSYCLQ